MQFQHGSDTNDTRLSSSAVAASHIIQKHLTVQCALCDLQTSLPPSSTNQVGLHIVQKQT
jgi:hypothetical protein